MKQVNNIISEMSVNNCWKDDLCHVQSRCPNRLSKTIVGYQYICGVVEKLVLMTPTYVYVTSHFNYIYMYTCVCVCVCVCVCGCCI